jgi:hypothetical protein
MTRVAGVRVVVLLAIAGVAFIVLVALVFGGESTGQFRLVGLRQCGVSPPINADEIGWTWPTDEEMVARGCKPLP